MNKNILEFYYDIFEEMPKSPNLKAELYIKRESYKSDKEFFTHMINYLGGRGYNHILNYGMFALHVIHIFRQKPFRYIDLYTLKGSYFIDQEIVEHLLFDDRHDLYQNMPCILESNEDKFKEDDICIMYEKLSDALIECIMFNDKDMDLTMGE